jgi:hypothetical protein
MTCEIIVCAAQHVRLSLAYEALAMTPHQPTGCTQRMQMEMIMLADLALQPITLPARSVHRIENAKGFEVTCARGVVWITQERDSRDLIVPAGQSVVLDRPGVAVVFAFRDSIITVGGERRQDEQRHLAAAPPSNRIRTYAERAWA